MFLLSFFMPGENKKNILIPNTTILRDKRCYSCGATLLDALFAPTHVCYHIRTFVNGEYTSSSLLLMFRVALESPFLQHRHTAFPAPAALCDGFLLEYLLFLNGLLDNNTISRPICQQVRIYFHINILIMIRIAPASSLRDMISPKNRTARMAQNTGSKEYKKPMRSGVTVFCAEVCAR